MPFELTKTTTDEEKRSMKMKQLVTMCGIAAALCLGAGTAFAQNNGGGGGGGFGGGGGGRGNFDPAQMQQRMMERVRDNLNFTNDTDWNAVQPLVQKVMDARRDLGGGGMGMFRGGRNRGGDQGGGGDNGGGRPRNPFFGQPSPEQQALQDALDNNAPDAQVKDLLARYEASQQKKQAALKAAQENLKAVLTPRQEASAALMGLVDQ
jgi:Spy/CpxP family protein refolding chaperone